MEPFQKSVLIYTAKANLSTKPQRLSMAQTTGPSERLFTPQADHDVCKELDTISLIVLTGIRQSGTLRPMTERSEFAVFVESWWHGRQSLRSACG
jgi:hypothetical protein